MDEAHSHFEPLEVLLGKGPASPKFGSAGGRQENLDQTPPNGSTRAQATPTIANEPRTVSKVGTSADYQGDSKAGREVRRR